MRSLHDACIKHERNMDVCYVITNAFDTGSTHLLRGFAVNMGYTKSWVLPKGNVSFIIKHEDISKWHICEDTDVRCLRYSEWSRLV